MRRVSHARRSAIARNAGHQGSSGRCRRAAGRDGTFRRLGFYLAGLAVLLLLTALAYPQHLNFYQYQTTEGPKFGMTARTTPELRQKDYTAKYRLTVSEPGKIKTWIGAAADEADLKELDQSIKTRLEPFRKATIRATEIYDATAARVTHMVNVEIIRHHALKYRNIVFKRFHWVMTGLLTLVAAMAGGRRAVR
jgi:hypothetical protein